MARPLFRLVPRTGVWVATLVLVAAGLLGVLQVARTGAPLAVVVVALGALSYLVYATWRDGGEHALAALAARPLDPAAVPTVARVVADVANGLDIDPPQLQSVDMDVPGAMVGREGGAGVVAVDPRLPDIMDESALRAVLAHELGHLAVGTLPMALRRYAPPVCGYAAFWTALLAGAGPTPASLGTVLFFASMFPTTRTGTYVRYAMGLGVEPALLLVERYASRQTEFLADETAAGVTSPEALTEALCRIAAEANGGGHATSGDVTDPTPFTADRSWWLSLRATHPSLEARIARLGSDVPEWMTPATHPNRPGAD